MPTTAPGPRPAEDALVAALGGLSDPERRCAFLLAYGCNGDMVRAARTARELAPRDAVEARLLALLDLLAPAAAKAVVTNGPLGPRLVNALTGVVEALDRHRGRGQPQVVRVERVVVEAGAQAVVGVVGEGVGGERRIEHQSHARALAVRGEVEADRVAVPAAQGEGAAAVPDARRAGRGAGGSGERPVRARPAQRGGAGGTSDGAGAAEVGAGRARGPGRG